MEISPFSKDSACVLQEELQQAGEPPTPSCMCWTSGGFPPTQDASPPQMQISICQPRGEGFPCSQGNPNWEPQHALCQGFYSTNRALKNVGVEVPGWLSG